VNKITDTETLDEIEEVAHRLRKSPATADSLPSTSHAIIRAFLNGGKTDDLLRILNDRMNYGVFLDFHVANILMDDFIKKGNHRGKEGLFPCQFIDQETAILNSIDNLDAAKVAGLLMLEEDFGPPTTKFLALVSCLKYVEEPTPEQWDPIPPPEESKDEVQNQND
jgi:small subunit ribosomal protein S27